MKSIPWRRLRRGATARSSGAIPKDLNGAGDFYDVKADLEALLALTGDAQAFRFEAAMLPALHPGRAARILRHGQPVGWLGELHPALVRELDFTYAPVLFEVGLCCGAAQWPGRPTRRFPAYPQVRRDLAIVVDESVHFKCIAERVVLRHQAA